MVNKSSGRRGRPPFEPSEEQVYSVELMAAIGIPHAEVAAAIGISEDTLRKHFRAQLDAGKVKVVTRVADSLVRQALAGNVTAAIFFLKTQGRWRESDPAADLGKKEAAQAAAESAAASGGKFAPPEAPPRFRVHKGGKGGAGE